MTPVLQTRGLEKRFGAVSAASDINVRLDPLEVVGLIGANGAGKTTFINMVTGYLTPSSGTIHFEGRDITGMAPRQIARLGISRSFQVAQTFESLSVMDNLLVAAGLHKDRGLDVLRRLHRSSLLSHCEAELKRYGIADYADHLAGSVPQGVRKVLDITMAMVSSPRLVLLDEPTSGVSTDERFPIMDKLVEALRRERVTVLLVEHDMDIIQRYTSRVLAFYDGRVICDAPPAQALADSMVRQYVLGDRTYTDLRIGEGMTNAVI